MRNLLKKLFGGKESSLPSVMDLRNLKGKRVLLRASLNVPIKDGEVGERFRIEAALPTLNFLKSAGAKVIVIAHIGRGKEESILPVHKVLEELAGVKWGGSLAEAAAKTASLQDGEAVLFENLRQDDREEGNDAVFAGELASLADVYVNDAFSDSHREHASIVGVPKLIPSYFGASFMKEYEALKKVMDPAHPALFIIGGAKFETKLPLVNRYAKSYDQVLVGGALANDIYKAKGYEVGTSLVSEGSPDLSALVNDPEIMTPNVVVVKGEGGAKSVEASSVQATEKILDADPAALEALRPYIESAKTILWNGPLGNYEEGFSEGTETLARMIASSSAYSVVGGGDTVASIRSLGLSDKFGFISTAGGAMLVFLETGTLPAIEAVSKST